MFRLFSRFDVKIFWVPIIFLSLSFFNPILSHWCLSKVKKTVYWLNRFLSRFFYSLKPNGSTKGFPLFCSVGFIGLFSLNLLSVYSFNFPLTRQPRVVLFLGLSFWVRILIVSTFNNLKGFLSHCVPEGTPTPLISFLFLIELVRNLIRPITLTVRLVANILAGHLLIILLSSAVRQFNFFFPIYIILNCVELAVAAIQAYIFTTIVVLYFSEV